MERAAKQEKEPSLGQEWADPEIFSIYESGRLLVRDAAKEVVKDVFEKYVPSDGIVVELGSGVGELSTLLPQEYGDNLIGVEKTERFTRVQKKNDSESKTVVADIYALPIKDESVDAVVSFSVFDTLSNLEKAIAEAKRVLKSGGRFVHLLDLQPNMHVLMRELPPDMIPFPNLVRDVVNGFQLVKKEDYEKVKGQIDPRKVQLLDLYVKDPMFMLAYLEQNGKQDISVDIARTIMSLGGIKKTTTPTLKESFGEKMIKVLQKNGFEVVMAGDKSAEIIVPKNEVHLKFPGYNYFENNVGSIYKRHHQDLDQALPSGQVMEKSTLHTIVAIK